MSDDARATRYHRLQFALAAAGLVLGLGYLVCVLATGVARDVTDGAGRFVAGWWWQVGMVTIALGAGHGLLVSPLTWVGGWALPRRYGLLHQSFLAWLGDRLKAAALGGALMLAGVEIVYGLLRITRWWWIIAVGFF